MDTVDLRKRTRSPDFCMGVAESDLDDMVQSLMQKADFNSDYVDLTASLCNILLINRDLHMNYFIPKYSHDTMQHFLDTTKTIEVSQATRFIDLVPIFRLAFLTLYGFEKDSAAKVLADVFQMLLITFHTLMGILDRCFDDDSYQMVLIELLKCLYTLDQKCRHGSIPVSLEHFTEECITIVNKSLDGASPADLSNNRMLLVQNSLNFLLILFSERDEDISHGDIYDGSFEMYSEFFEHLKLLLKFELTKLKSNTMDDNKLFPNIINLLVIVNFMSQKLISDKKNSQCFDTMHKRLGNPIIPEESDSFTYNSLIFILGTPSDVDLTNHSIEEMQQLNYIKQLTVKCLYNLSWSPDVEAHQRQFLKLVGYINARMFLDENAVQIVPAIDVDQYLEPSCQYLDHEKYRKIRESRLHVDTKRAPAVELTEEEKEQEADKLFTLFERMEKIGTFQNFQNPVKKWQREGKFEELNE